MHKIPKLCITHAHPFARITEELQRKYDEFLESKLSEQREAFAEKEEALLQQLNEQKQNFYAEIDRLKSNFEEEKEKFLPGSPSRGMAWQRLVE